MVIWFPLLVAPILALVDQSVALSMTGWACRGQHGLALHVVHAAFALVAAAALGFAWRTWRQIANGGQASESRARRRFFAGMAVGASALSLLVIVTMWMPTWVLSSCLE